MSLNAKNAAQQQQAINVKRNPPILTFGAPPEPAAEQIVPKSETKQAESHLTPPSKEESLTISTTKKTKRNRKKGLKFGASDQISKLGEMAPEKNITQQKAKKKKMKGMQAMVSAVTDIANQSREIQIEVEEIKEGVDDLQAALDSVGNWAICKDQDANSYPELERIMSTPGPQLKLAKSFSEYSELPDLSEKSLPEIQRKRDEEIQMLQFQCDKIRILAAPTGENEGSFLATLGPNCGMDVVGCSCQIRVNYLKSSENVPDFQVELIQEKADGLTEQMIEDLKEEIGGVVAQADRSSLHDVFTAIRDYLGRINCMTKKYLNHMQLVQQEEEREMQRIQQEKLAKQAQRRLEDYEKKQRLLVREEARWCNTLAQQTFENRASQILPALNSQAWNKDEQSDDAEDSKVDKKKKEQKNDEKQLSLQHQSSVTSSTLGNADGPSRQQHDMTLDTLPMSRRYASDFEEVCKIGQGGFGMVYKARHRLDGNIYAIKKIKLSDKMNGEENKRIRREVTYLSSLNNQYIVRYFQTWVEHETDPQIIELFEDESDSYYDSEESEEESDSQSEMQKSVSKGRKSKNVAKDDLNLTDDSFEMIKEEEESDGHDLSSSNKKKNADNQKQTNKNSKRASSLTQKSKKSKIKTKLPFQQLQASQESAESRSNSEDSQSTKNRRRMRAMTDTDFIGSQSPPESKTPKRKDTEKKLTKNELKSRVLPQVVSNSHTKQNVGQIGRSRQNQQNNVNQSSGDESEELIFSQDPNYFNDEAFSGASPAKLSQSDGRDFDMASEYTHNTKQQFPLVPGIKILYIQMQFCEGQTLDDFLKENPLLKNEALKWRIFRQLTEAVSYLQTRGIIHRDIKPENVFLDHNKDARLGDFGLAKRVHPHNQHAGLDKKPIANEEQEPAQLSSLQGGNSQQQKRFLFVNHTTGVGTQRFAAPEQIQMGNDKAKKEGSGGGYGFKADVYSLGVTLLDMFREQDVSVRELFEIHSQMQKGKVEESIAKKMPKKAVILIEKMIQRDPELRPSVMEILQSDLLPQDEILKDFLVPLVNHRNPKKLHLLRFLHNQPTPKALDLAYFGTYDYIPTTCQPRASRFGKIAEKRQLISSSVAQGNNISAASTSWSSPQAMSNLFRRQTSNVARQPQAATKDEQRAARIHQFSLRMKHIFPAIVSDLKEVSQRNGFYEVADAYVVTPTQNSATLFLSRAMRTAPYISQIESNMVGKDVSTNQDELKRQLKAISGPKQNTSDMLYLDEDFLCLNMLSEEGKEGANNQAGRVKPLLDFELPSWQGASGWQSYHIKNHKSFACSHQEFKMTDEVGIVLSLQSNQVTALARKISKIRPKGIKRLFLKGQVWYKSALMQGNVANSVNLPNQMSVNRVLGPVCKTEATFCLVAPQYKNPPPTSKSKTDQSNEDDQQLTRSLVMQSKVLTMLKSMSWSDLMHEVEILRICASNFKHWWQGSQTKFELRVSSSELIDALFEECQVSLSDRPLLIEYLLSESTSVDADLKKLVKTGTNTKQMLQRVDTTKLSELMKIRGSCEQITRAVRAQSGIRYRSRFLDAIAYFQRLEEGLALFDVLSGDPEDFDSQRLRHRQVNKIAPIESAEQREKTCSSSRRYLADQYKVSGHRHCLVFDFGLILKHYDTFYSGLIFSVVSNSAASEMKTKKLKVSPSRIQEQKREEVLAYGGRFDNAVAHFQLELRKYLPLCVGVTFRCTVIADRLARPQGEQLNCRQHRTVDIVIGSIEQGSCIERKILIMGKLQYEGYRVTVDYSDTISNEFLEENNVHFVVLVQPNTDRLLYRVVNNGSSLKGQQLADSQNFHEVPSTKILVEELRNIDQRGER